MTTHFRKLHRPFAFLMAFLLLGACGLKAQTPLNLFNGSSLSGWVPRGAWSIAVGIVSSSGTQDRGLMSAVPFADFNLTFDYYESASMNARFRVWAPRDGRGGNYIDLDPGGQPAGPGGVEGATGSRQTAPLNAWHHVQVEANNGQLTVHLDGQTSANLPGGTSRGGYLGWEVGGNGTLQIRNARLALTNLTPAFNGADLSSWKAVAHNPSSKGGIGHDMTKTITFGLGGGSTKAHSAKWNVQGGAIHGEDGPGGLEFNSPISDAIINITASIKGQPKPEHFTALSLRDTSGQLEGGYPVGVGPFSGSIEDLAKHALAGSNGQVEETIIIGGRTIAMWVGGNLANVYTDSRPESTRVSLGARDSAGTVTLVLPGDGVKLDVQKVSITTLPKNYGSTAAAAPVVLAGNPSTDGGGASSGAAHGGAAGGGGGGGGANPMETALLQQQKLQQAQADSDRQNKQKVASLMALALSTADPGKQMDLYNQVVQIDPSNAPAVQGYKDAQAKLQAGQAAQDQQQAAQVNQQHDALTKDQQVNESLVKAQSAFLAGHVAEAGSALTVAERLAPDNPVVRDLRSRINATSSLHSRVFYLGSAAGVIALLAAIGLWIRRKKTQRFPMLEITSGMDVGEQFRLDKDLIGIGAVAQDGGQKNDIVLRDIDRAISRFHCEIARKNGQLYLTDLKSSNGTKLEGVPLQPGEPALLRRGNRILVANTVELRFGYGAAPKA